MATPRQLNTAYLSSARPLSTLCPHFILDVHLKLNVHGTVYIGPFHEKTFFCKFKMSKVDSWSMGQMSLMSENALSPNMTLSLFQTGLDPPPTQRNYDGEIRQQRYLVITFDWEVLLTEDQCI